MYICGYRNPKYIHTLSNALKSAAVFSCDRKTGKGGSVGAMKAEG